MRTAPGASPTGPPIATMRTDLSAEIERRLRAAGLTAADLAPIRDWNTVILRQCDCPDPAVFGHLPQHHGKITGRWSDRR